MAWSRLFAGLAIAAVMVPTRGMAEVIAFSAVQDTTLCESATGDTSNGAGSYFFAGRNGMGEVRRGLLAFDVAGQVPASSNIEQAVLQLSMSRTRVGTSPVALLAVLAPWGEGTSDAGGQEGGCAPSSPGDATWVHRFFSNTFWTVPGGDFAPGAGAIQAVGGIGTYLWGPTAKIAADVQSWLDSPASNFGWVVVGDETATSAKRFDSRENVDASARPVLFVDYRAPEATTDLAIFPASGRLALTSGFDLTVVVDAPGLSVVGGDMTLDGVVVMPSFANCAIPGTLSSGGTTLRCPGLSGNVLSSGFHIVIARVDLSDGTSVSDLVVWEVLPNTEP